MRIIVTIDLETRFDGDQFGSFFEWRDETGNETVDEAREQALESFENEAEEVIASAIEYAVEDASLSIKSLTVAVAQEEV